MLRLLRAQDVINGVTLEVFSMIYPIITMENGKSGNGKRETANLSAAFIGKRLEFGRRQIAY